jgi:[ribosomal protein S5]-alanine N-acetyltransferase
VQIPTLESSRLILRPFREADCAALAAIHCRPEVARFVMPGGVPQSTMREAFDNIAAAMGHWALRGHGRWAVDERATGRMIGRCGYNDFPYEWPGLELGWTFHPDVWGRGYATEAANAAVAWGFGVAKFETIIHLIAPENTASQAVATRLGAAPGEAWEGRGIKAVIWSQTRAQWEARPRQA